MPGHDHKHIKEMNFLFHHPLLKKTEMILKCIHQKGNKKKHEKDHKEQYQSMKEKTTQVGRRRRNQSKQQVGRRLRQALAMQTEVEMHEPKEHQHNTNQVCDLIATLEFEINGRTSRRTATRMTTESPTPT